MNKEKDPERDSEISRSPQAPSDRSGEKLFKPNYTPGSKREITQDECYSALGFCFPFWKKWLILTVIFIVQMSMNFNTSVYPNAVTQLSEYFHISEQHARGGQAAFLIAYAFGSELWAPWSEDFGRWPILQLSLALVNIWELPAALAHSWSAIIAARILGGFSSAGGSVTLGMVADMWESDDQQYAVAYVVLSSVGGSTIGPVIGGFIQSYLQWRWNFWIQLIFGAFTQACHFFLVPETRATIMMDKIAKKRRQAAEKGQGPREDLNLYGPNEMHEGPRITLKSVGETWIRPFYMFATEPIVLCLSMLSGFSDALIFTFLEGFDPVFDQWGFNSWQKGLCFCTILVGYVLGYFSFLPFIHRDRVARRKATDSLAPERRLFWLLFTAPLETIGLFGFAWTSLGPAAGIPWIAPLIFACLIAIANYSIYMATIDYMVAAYGPYSASATGGNALARDFLAGVAAYYATPLYSNVGGKNHLEYASTILACLAILVTSPIYIFYWKGEWFRNRSKFAQSLNSASVGGRRVSSVHGSLF